MLNARLGEIARKPDAPFLGASASYASFFARNLNAVTFGGGVKDGGIERGIEAVLAEARRANQFGFLASEFQRAKDNTLRAAQAAYDARSRVRRALGREDPVDPDEGTERRRETPRRTSSPAVTEVETDTVLIETVETGVEPVETDAPREFLLEAFSGLRTFVGNAARDGDAVVVCVS
jgi:hypothetical protein